MTLTSTFPVIDLQKTGRNIEKYRKDSGLTVRDLQEYFGFEYPQAIYKWQHGECLPAVDNLLALALLFGIKIEDLLVYENREVSYPAA
ncbi:MAG: helix-turn-helix transcriptional regulator [Synergistaceae bacterium]|nr:helix-turn-helix transcriptional regulator [Synergistaceae bacterium]MBQ3398991.1 helix-turn-helix transcriptional regulator [Synergistaceae bacterium]MBQ4402713.1 helix-turn-helix transcriptional regulator [Synergistaceae bacterium]MBQ6114429.1 helix-turn-helix transcriptional regulator [Synergistaceae bacterium]MBQ6417938.1 helix-turn-helix transcriptional regulator [Synergistaceae bacterium]